MAGEVDARRGARELRWLLPAGSRLPVPWIRGIPLLVGRLAGSALRVPRLRLRVGLLVGRLARLGRLGRLGRLAGRALVGRLALGTRVRRLALGPRVRLAFLAGKRRLLAHDHPSD